MCIQSVKHFLNQGWANYSQPQSSVRLAKASSNNFTFHSHLIAVISKKVITFNQMIENFKVKTFFLEINSAL